jgi:hypothetical protein
LDAIQEPNVFNHARLSTTTVLSAGLSLFFFNLSAIGQAMPGIINPLLYPGADLCLQIQAAISANEGAFPQGIIVDARSATGIQHCSVSPLSGATVPGQLLLGATVLQTTAPIVTPSIPAWQILGIGRGNGPNLTGTLIQAVTGFPAGGKVVRLGDGTNLAFGNRIENLAIDCNNIAGTIGLYSSDIQEQSGGSYLIITSCPARGLWINGSGNEGVAPFADNYDFHDLEAYGPSGSPSNVGCEFDGNFTHQGNGPHLVSALTCNGAVTDFIFDGISASTVANLNAEHATTGYLIGNNAPLNGVSFEGLNSGTITGDVVHIQKVVSAAGNFNEGLSFTSIINGGAVAPITVQDDVLNVTLHDFVVGNYSIGAQLPRSGSGYTHSSSSPNVSSVISQLTTDNGADTANVLRLGSGNTAAQASIVEFDDRGLPKWNMGKDGSDDFQIFDIATGVLRFFAPAGSFPFTGISSAGSAPVLLNLFGGSGSGGVLFGSGGTSPTTHASVSSTGVGAFAQVAISSLGASTRPLCTTTGGVIVNTGCLTGSTAAVAPAVAEGGSLSGGVASVFGRIGSIVAVSGDYNVTQVVGAAPIDSPFFTGSLTSPSVGGSGSASFTLGQNELVGGADANVSCTSGHTCDSYSGTVRLVTGSGSISAAGATAATVILPFPRQNLPNCIVTITTNAAKTSMPITLGYPNTYSIAITATDALSASTGYDIVYLCGGN